VVPATDCQLCKFGGLIREDSELNWSQLRTVTDCAKGVPRNLFVRRLHVVPSVKRYNRIRSLRVEGEAEIVAVTTETATSNSRMKVPTGERESRLQFSEPKFHQSIVALGACQWGIIPYSSSLFIYFTCIPGHVSMTKTVANYMGSKGGLEVTKLITCTWVQVPYERRQAGSVLVVVASGLKAKDIFSPYVMLSSQYHPSLLGSSLGALEGLCTAGARFRNKYSCLTPSIVLERSKIDGRNRRLSILASFRASRRSGQSKMRWRWVRSSWPPSQMTSKYLFRLRSCQEGVYCCA
jgi:hypothetical protein